MEHSQIGPRRWRYFLAGLALLLVGLVALGFYLGDPNVPALSHKFVDKLDIPIAGKAGVRLRGVYSNPFKLSISYISGGMSDFSGGLLCVVEDMQGRRRTLRCSHVRIEGGVATLTEDR